MLHKRWKPCVKKFTLVNESIAYVDISRRKLHLRLIATYFPHGGYTDNHVQQIYNTLSTIKREGVRNKRHVIIGADCNAKVYETNAMPLLELIAMQLLGNVVMITLALLECMDAELAMREASG